MASGKLSGVTMWQSGKSGFGARQLGQAPQIHQSLVVYLERPDDCDFTSSSVKWVPAAQKLL